MHAFHGDAASGLSCRCQACSVALCTRQQAAAVARLKRLRRGCRARVSQSCFVRHGQEMGWDEMGWDGIGCRVQVGRWRRLVWHPRASLLPSAIACPPCPCPALPCPAFWVQPSRPRFRADNATQTTTDRTSNNNARGVIRILYLILVIRSRSFDTHSHTT